MDQTKARRLRKTACELSATSSLVADALNNFTNALDTLGDPLSEEQEKQATQYIETAHKVIDQAQGLAIDIEASLMGAREVLPPAEMATAKLPAIPIPTITGKIWEFNNFWTLFDANVHQQPLTRLQKFNYLINALRGEARDLIRRYPVTESNYDHAIDLLKTKYGNESALIGHLQSRLEMAKAESKSIHAQRRLLENILPIVTQLEEHRVSLDGSYLTQKILSKFSTALQRKTLESCIPQNKQESDWKLRSILSILDNLISTEEQINEMVDKNDRNDSITAYHSEKPRKVPSKNILPLSSQQNVVLQFQRT